MISRSGLVTSRQANMGWFTSLQDGNVNVRGGVLADDMGPGERTK